MFAECGGVASIESNSQRKHGSNDLLSPVEFESRYLEWLGCV